MKNRKSEFYFIALIMLVLLVLVGLTWANYQFVMQNPGGNDFIPRWVGSIQWSQNHLYASLLFLSFFLLPYASQQSVSSVFAFVPSWPLLAIQFAGILFTRRYLDYYNDIPLNSLISLPASWKIILDT